MNVEAYIAKPKRLWRSVVLSTPIPFGRNRPPHGTFLGDPWLDRFARRDDHAKDKLKRAAMQICRKLNLNPKRVRVRCHTLQRRYFAYIPIYEGEGTDEERALFKRGMKLASRI